MIGGYNIRERSTHVTRDKTSKDQALEQLLEIWGAWRAGAIQGLGHGISPIERAVQRLIRTDKAQPRETRVIRPSVPKYYTKPFLSRINRAILSLEEKHHITLIRKYEDNWQTRDFMDNWGWEIKTVYNRLSDARGEARNHQHIKEALYRS